MAASNLKLFDENKANMLSDEEYNTNTQRLNGVQTGVASSSLQNKTLYQTSLVAYAIGQLMIANGKDATDSAVVSTFVANMDATMLQKVKDIATTEEAQQGLLNTKYMTPALTKVAIEYMCVLKSGSTMTGPLILSGAPTQENQAVPKSYVDSSIGGIFEEVTFPNYDVFVKLAKQYTLNGEKSEYGLVSINYVDGEYLIATGGNSVLGADEVTNSYDGFFIKFTIDSDGTVQNFVCNKDPEIDNDAVYATGIQSILSKIGDDYYLIRSASTYNFLELYKYNFNTNKLTYIGKLTNITSGYSKIVSQSKKCIYIFHSSSTNEIYEYIKYDGSTLSKNNSAVSLIGARVDSVHSCDNGIFFVNQKQKICSIKDNGTIVNFDWKTNIFLDYYEFISPSSCFVKDNYLYAYAQSTSSSNSKYTFVRCAFGSSEWEKLFDYQGEFTNSPYAVFINNIPYWYSGNGYVVDVEKQKVMSNIKSELTMTGEYILGNYCVSANYVDASSNMGRFDIYIRLQNAAYTFQNIKNAKNGKLSIAAVDSGNVGNKIVLYDGGSFKIVF